MTSQMETENGFAIEESFVRPTFQSLGMPIYMERLSKSFQSSK